MILCDLCAVLGWNSQTSINVNPGSLTFLFHKPRLCNPGSLLDPGLWNARYC